MTPEQTRVRVQILIGPLTGCLMWGEGLSHLGLFPLVQSERAGSLRALEGLSTPVIFFFFFLTSWAVFTLSWVWQPLYFSLVLEKLYPASEF